MNYFTTSSPLLTLATLGWALLILLVAPGSALAQPTVDVQTELDRREIEPNGELRYEVNVTVDGNYDINMSRDPDFEGFAVLGRSVEPTFRMHNFNTMRSLRLEYRLRAPSRNGEYTLRGPEFTVGDEAVSADSLSVTVTGDASTPQTVTPDQDQSDQSAFVNVSLSPDRDPYVGEQLILQYELYINQRERRLRARPPGEAALDDFWIEDITQDLTLRRSRKQLHGQHWNVTPLRAFALFPIRSGPTIIDSIEVPLVEASLFGGGEQKLIESQPLELNVQPLPDGAPEGFSSGNVGTWDFDVDIDSHSARVGGRITVTATIDGTGRPARLGEPIFEAGDAFRHLSSSDDYSQSLRQGRLGGTRTFVFHLVPLKEGVHEVPALTFSYFDPDAGEYVTRRSDPMEVTIEPGELPPELEVEEVTRSERSDPATPELPLAHLDGLLEPGSLTPRSSSLPYPFWLLLLPLIGLLLLLVERPLTRPILRRLSPKFRRRQLQRQIDEILDSSDDPLPTQCLRALRLCLNDGLQCSMGALTTDEVAQALASLDVPAPLQASTTALVDELVAQRYAPHSTHSTSDLEHRTQGVITELLDWHFQPTPDSVASSGAASMLVFLGLTATIAASTLIAMPAHASDIAFPDHNGDWQLAMEYWSELSDENPQDPTYQFNAGIAAAQAGEIGLARVHMERALRLGADPSLVRDNLYRVTATVAAQDASVAAFRQQSSVATALHHLAPWVALMAIWAIFVLAIARRITDQPQSRSTTAILCLTAVAIALTASLLWWYVEDFQSSPDPGVVIAAEEILRQAPSHHATAASDDPLPAGAMIRTIETRDDWTRLELPTGQQGWLPNPAIAQINVN